jgi:2-keto-3-deoxy-L-rhamnonate aldolase RhmA
MIETKTAVENLEAILDVKGIAGVYVGPQILVSPTACIRRSIGPSRRSSRS